MQDQTDFIVLDGVMVAVATVALSAAHPGYMFPEMQMHRKNEKVVGVGAGEKGDSDGSDVEVAGAVKGGRGRGRGGGLGGSRVD